MKFGLLFNFFLLFLMFLAYGCATSEPLPKPRAEERPDTTFAPAGDRMKPFLLPDTPATSLDRRMFSYAHDTAGIVWNNQSAFTNSFRTRGGDVYLFYLEPLSAHEFGLSIKAYSTDLITQLSLSSGNRGFLSFEVDWPPRKTSAPPWKIDPTKRSGYMEVKPGVFGRMVLVKIWDSKTASLHSLELDIETMLLALKHKLVDDANRLGYFRYEMDEVVVRTVSFKWSKDHNEENVVIYSLSSLTNNGASLLPKYFINTHRAPKGQATGAEHRIADRIPVGSSGYSLEWRNEKKWFELKRETEIGSKRVEGGSVQSVFQKSKKAVVKLNTGKAVGTGFIATRRGQILTNRHVIEDAPSGRLTVIFEDQSNFPGKVVKIHPFYDLALVEIDQPIGQMACLEISPRDLMPGESASIIGHPLGVLDWSISRATIAGFREEAGLRYVQLDAAINPGNSGGPVLDSEGRVVGVVYARKERTGERLVQNIGTAIPAGIAVEFLKEYLP